MKQIAKKKNKQKKKKNWKVRVWEINANVFINKSISRFKYTNRFEYFKH